MRFGILSKYVSNKSKGWNTDVHIAYKNAILDALLMGNATIWDFASVSKLANILGVTEKMVTLRKKRMSEETFSGLQPFCGVPTKKKKM